MYLHYNNISYLYNVTKFSMSKSVPEILYSRFKNQKYFRLYILKKSFTYKNNYTNPTHTGYN